VGYPGFIPLQNSVPMPIARVVAVCHGDDWCARQIIYSMQPHPSFYMSADSGDIFLVNNAGSGSVQETCDQPCQLKVFADHAYLQVPQASLTVQISALTENQILVLDSNSSYTEAESAVSKINDETELYWFRPINIQPRQQETPWYRTVVSEDKSVLFVTANKVEGHVFVDKNEASDIIDGMADSDVGVDSNINVNNQQPQPDGPDVEGGGGGGDKTAVIVLAVLLALVILGVLIAIFVIKRKFFLSLLPKKKEEGEAMLQSSTENSSITAYKAEEKNRKDSKGLFNLQSVTIQTSQQTNNNPRAKAAVGANQPGLMREMSTELEKRLEARKQPENSQPQLNSKYQTKSMGKTVQNISKKKPAPNIPAPSGIKFNERAEVMEVEKTKRLSISSGTSDSSEDSSSSGSSSSSVDSVIDDSEKVTRI